METINIHPKEEDGKRRTFDYTILLVHCEVPTVAGLRHGKIDREQPEHVNDLYTHLFPCSQATPI